MCDENILEEVEYSNWASPIVVVPKSDGSIRICMDCRVTINKSVMMKHYPLPVIDDIFARFNGCSVFCVLDLAGAYQQLEVAEECREFLTINTHKGLFRYKRLPFGVSTAPSNFQRIMDEILKEISNVCCYLDDVLVGGETKEDCETKLCDVLKRLDAHSVRINMEKCKFFKSSVEYLGHEICAEGIKPNKKKIEAIVRAPDPENLTQLKSYLGLMNYYAKFVPNLSSELIALYRLTKKDVKFEWTSECKEVYRRSKKLLLENNLLVHYDPKKPIIITCDASPYGVGAVLSHLINGIERPVLFASSTLTDAERNYSQLHREALAVIFALKKFHKYVYGYKFVIHSDHQPLKEIFGPKRGVLPVAAARIQRWAIYLSMYDCELVYKKGSSIPQADALSRLPMKGDTEVESCSINFCDDSSENEVLVSIVDVRNATERDEFMQKLYDCLMNGFDKVDDRFSFYEKNKSAFSCENGCVYYGNRLVVPESIRQKVLNLLHDGHIGMVRMKMLARTYVWWRGIDRDVEEWTKSCNACAVTQNGTKNVMEVPWKQSTRPYERIHIDFFELCGTKFLLLVDSFSKWMEVAVMRKTDAINVIEKLREWFSSMGIPKIVVSDNGPPFNSNLFIDFCESNGITVMKSPPYSPQSNGLAERGVQTVKNALKAFLVDPKTQKISMNQKLANFLLKYRNTPTTTTMCSPSEMIFQFKPRTLLEILNDRPVCKTISNVSKIKNNNRFTNSRNGSRFHSDDKLCKKNEIFFKSNENVYYRNCFKNYLKWIPATVLQRISKVVYRIKVNGVERTAHCNQLKKCNKRQFNYSSFAKMYRNNIPIKEYDESCSSSQAFGEDDNYKNQNKNSENELQTQKFHRSKRIAEIKKKERRVRFDLDID